MSSQPDHHPNNGLAMPGLPQLLSSEDESSADESSHGNGSYHGELVWSSASTPPAAVKSSISKTHSDIAHLVYSLEGLHQSPCGSKRQCQQPPAAAAAAADAVTPTGILIDITAAPEEEADGGKDTDTPMRKHRRNWSGKMRDLLAPKRLERCRTPPREAPEFATICLEPTPAGAAPSTPCTPSTPYDSVDDYRLTSTEQDPSPFQVEPPPKAEVLAHSRICALMDGYAAVDRDFNFAMIAGVGRSTLRREYEGSTAESPMIAGSCHRDVVGQLLDCADDLVVEGFFREYTEGGDDADSERVEACIFSSESLRQIIVCFRGSTMNQAKPLGKSGLFGKQVSCILSNDEKVPVMQNFHAAYFGTPLERAVFTLLENLIARKPFFDVVITGHSFGAAMATIASLRYALSNSQIRVSCHVFGSPRVGGERWRQIVHSVPNLRVYRIENRLDPYVMLPSESEWVHCGHAIKVVHKRSGVEFRAHRFDRDASLNSHIGLRKSIKAKSQGKVCHEIQAYVDNLVQSGEVWFEDFCGLNGDGVSGMDNEKRTLA